MDLIILSAKLISIELRNQFGDIPSVMIPFEGKPLLKSQYEFFQIFYNNIYLILEENFSIVEDYLKVENMPKVKLVSLKDSKSLEDSLISIGKSFTFNQNPVSILFGDTFFTKIDVKNFNSNFIFVSNVEDSSRWTIIKDGLIYDKKILVNEPPFKAITGFFNFENSSKFFYELENYGFYGSIQKLLLSNKIEVIENTTWIDLGHEDNLLKTKKNSTRYFNEIKVDFNRGILTKFSTNTDKFRNEINWYRSLPKKVSYIAPRILGWNFSKSRSSLDMEYYGYDTLHEKYLYGNFSIQKWETIFEVLFFSISELHKYKKKISTKKLYKNAYEMYILKPLNRLKKTIEDQTFFKHLLSSPFVINKIYVESIHSILDKVTKLSIKLKIFDISDFSFIHGDFFFSNILYDFRNDFVRLIDPRGLFGTVRNYGDRRYDYAKLLHSINGKYNLIIEDKFILKNENNNYSFFITTNLSQNNSLKAFINVAHRFGLNISQLKFIEITLFLSMVTMHSDSLERQKAMLFTGILLLNELEKEI